MRPFSDHPVPLDSDSWITVLQVVSYDTLHDPLPTVQAVGCCCVELYWITRPYLWRAIGISDTDEIEDFVRISASATPNPPNVNLGSYVRRLSLKYPVIRQPQLLFSVISPLCNLADLTLDFAPPTHGGPIPQPYAIFQVLQDLSTPLRRVRLRGDRVLPTLPQLNFLTSRFHLHDLDVQGFFTGQEAEAHSLDVGSSHISTPTICHLRLSPSHRAAPGLGKLLSVWNLDLIEELTVNSNVDVNPWLRKFGARIQRLSIPAEHAALVHPRSPIAHLCPSLRVLTVLKPSGDRLLAELPASLEAIRIVTRDLRGASSSSREVAMLQSFLPEIPVHELPLLQLIQIKGPELSFPPLWQQRFTQRLHQAGVVMELVPFSPPC